MLLRLNPKTKIEGEVSKLQTLDLQSLNEIESNFLDWFLDDDDFFQSQSIHSSQILISKNNHHQNISQFTALLEIWLSLLLLFFENDNTTL